MIRVAIVDDHIIVRTGLKYLVEADPGLELAGEFGGGVGAVDFYLNAKPDVTLLDVRMPDRGGIDVLHDILAVDPGARIVMLTTSDVEEDVFRAIEDGALGYVMKESPIETIAAAISLLLAPRPARASTSHSRAESPFADLRASYIRRTSSVMNTSPSIAERIAAAIVSMGLSFMT